MIYDFKNVFAKIKSDIDIFRSIKLSWLSNIEREPIPSYNILDTVPIIPTSCLALHASISNRVTLQGARLPLTGSRKSAISSVNERR